MTECQKYGCDKEGVRGPVCFPNLHDEGVTTAFYCEEHYKELLKILGGINKYED